MDRVTLSEVMARADGYASASDWQALHDFLTTVDRDILLSTDGLAYRFGEALFHVGRMTELAAFADDYSAAARSRVSPEGVLRALNLGGIAAFELGRVKEAGSKFEALMELASAEGSDEMLARAANNLGALSNLSGRHDEALTYYQMAIPLYQREGQTRGLAQTHHNLGITFRDLEDLKEADSSYTRAARLAAGFGYEPIVAMSTIGRAEIALLAGDPDLATELAGHGTGTAQRLGDPITEGNGLRVGALAADAAGTEWPAVSGELDRALELARETGHLLLEAEIHRDLGRLSAARGDTSTARAELSIACDQLSALGAEGQLAKLQDELSLLS